MREVFLFERSETEFYFVENATMDTFLKASLLFGLNFLDAILTLFWVRQNMTEEGNPVMAHLLGLGDAPFLIVKILIGTAAFLVFIRWCHLRVSQIGLSFALYIYLGIAAVHLLTGLTVAGLKF